MELGQDTCSFRNKIAAKTEKIAQEVEKESKQSRAGGTHGRACQAARPCHHHDGPWWALPGHPLSLPNAAFSTCSSPRTLPVLGHFGPLFAIFFDPHGLKNIF